MKSLGYLAKWFLIVLIILIVFFVLFYFFFDAALVSAKDFKDMAPISKSLPKPLNSFKYMGLSEEATKYILLEEVDFFNKILQLTPREQKLLTEYYIQELFPDPFDRKFLLEEREKFVRLQMDKMLAERRQFHFFVRPITYHRFLMFIYEYYRM